MPIFTIKENHTYTLVVFAEFVDEMRTPDNDKKLVSLVEKNDLVIDLSGCKAVDTQWVRLITTLSSKAKRYGHRVAVVGPNDEIKKVAEWIGHLCHWNLFTTVNDAVMNE